MANGEDHCLVAVVDVVSADESNDAASTYENHIVCTSEANEADNAKEATDFVKASGGTVASRIISRSSATCVREYTTRSEVTLSSQSVVLVLAFVPVTLMFPGVSLCFEPGAALAPLTLTSMPGVGGTIGLELDPVALVLLEVPAVVLEDAAPLSRGTCLASSMRRLSLQICGSSSER